MLKEIHIRLDVDEKQLKALSELLPSWHQRTTDKSEKPFAYLTEERLLELILYCGSRSMIWEKIKEEQYQQGMITMDELLDGRYLTVAERRNCRETCGSVVECVGKQEGGTGHAVT